MMNDYAHVIINFFGVLVLMYVMSYIVKKIKFTKLTPNTHVKIIHSVSIGTREKIILMEVNQTHLLIGATPNHIETLHVFNEMKSDTSTNNIVQMVELTDAHRLNKEVLGDHVLVD